VTQKQNRDPVLSGIFFLFLPVKALAKENIVKQDSDNDGKIDRIAYFDGAGKISKLGGPHHFRDRL
jgi:hypothetical protein